MKNLKMPPFWRKNAATSGLGESSATSDPQIVGKHIRKFCAKFQVKIQKTVEKPVEIYIARRNMMLWIMFQSFFLMQYNTLQHNTLQYNTK